MSVYFDADTNREKGETGEASSREERERGRNDVRAAVDELSAVLDELAGHLHDLLHLV